MRQRVVAGVSGSLGSVTALHRAAAEARARGAELWVVLAWQPPGGLGTHRFGDVSVLTAGQEAAAARLGATLRAAFGAGPDRASRIPPAPDLTALTARGGAGEVLVDFARDADDLLVVGTGRPRRPVHRALHRSVARYCLAYATCPVMTVPPSPLQSALESVRRRNAWGLPLDARELAG
ncbi:universal stress protein [Streptomyces sp. NPDC002073]|uniref:universal stress protein n=1 Tax=Streptomyces sp. NBC_00239 TaxID=2903640 RepID=UPI002E28F7A9|nr:universal stress protein [Streptomyces sp. NBC_00239]